MLLLVVPWLAAAARVALGGCYCYCFATSTTPIFQSYFASFQRSRKGRRKQLENESRKVSASQKLLRRRYGGVRRGVVAAVAAREAVARSTVVRKQRVKKIDAFKKVFLSFFFFLP